MYSAIAQNKLKTVLLIAAFIAFISTLGYFFGLALGRPSLFYFIGIGALIYSLITYWLSDRIALGMAGAQPIKKSDAPQLYRIVENLSIADGLPMPRVYIIPDAALNAFATGRNPKNSAVAVTSGLLEALEDEELEGVIAHELSHIKNYDIRLSSVVAALVSVVSLLSDFLMNFSFFGGNSDDEEGLGPFGWIVGLLVAIIAPLIALMIQLAVSRRREYLADASGALLTRYPPGLANALRKISQSQPMSHASAATAHLYIANPFGKGSLTRLFSTHPPAADRIRRLEEMGGRA